MAICPFMSGYVYNGASIEFKEKQCIKEQCQLWDSINQRCGTFVSDVNIKILKRSPGVTKAQIYSQEFLTMEDIDNNGKIYGKDFRLANPPPALKSLESHPDFNFSAEVVDE